MRKTFSLLATVLLLAVGALAVEATVKPATAQAFVFAGSCNWPTTGQWFFSPSYGVWFVYVGHSYINGHYYRTFYTIGFGIAQYYVVYCGG